VQRLALRRRPVRGAAVIDRNLSFSQIKTWLECRRRWGYRFRDGYLPVKPNLDFMRGSLLHAGMEHLVIEDAYPTLDIAWAAAVTQWNQEWNVDPGEWVGFEEFVAGCRKIVEGAVECFRQDWRIIWDDQGPLLERRFYTDLPGWKGLVFIPDAVCERLTGPFAGGVFGVDFKSYGKPKPDLAGELDLQGAIYQRGLRGKGFEATGSCLYQLATTPPKEPRVNKDGTVNKTDERMVLSWKPVSGEVVTYRSIEFLEGVWNQVVIPTANEIAALGEGGDDSKLIPRFDYYACNFCDYRGPCLARLKGHDEQDILAGEYTMRPKKGV
jgi:hypothetical protein